MKGYIKDPDATLDYSFDWTPWLGADNLSGSTWEITPSGAPIVPGSDIYTTKTTTVYITGGEIGVEYTLTNRVTTAAQRTDDRSIKIRIQER